MTDNAWRPDAATVIGAGAGIGRAVALEFASRGRAVIALSRNGDNLTGLQDEADRRSAVLRTVQCDVTEPDQFRKVLSSATSPIVLHTAGSALPIGPIWQCDPAVAMQSLSSMVLSSWLTAQACLEQLLARGSGIVLLASSGAASKAAPARSTYSMSKAAVDQLVRVVGAELRLVSADVGIAAFYPGMVDTGMQQQVREAAEPFRSGPFGAELSPFLHAAQAGTLVPAEVVARHLADLAARPPGELNGKIWRLREGEWLPHE
ncbi:MAG: hypothetical protein QOK10_2609 [Pseudonocardiales bacterium]|jgi:NAD(P)-dependent dehydrogenase (short-subunit alcohol dehydrogenase family)|nr:hypothetical protein [Pseudonocardiales bacterium]